MSPFKSKHQQRFMFATMPETAEEWAKETDFSKLPEKVKKKDKNDLINNCVEKATIFAKEAQQGQALQFHQSQMTPLYLKTQAQRILNRLNESDAPTHKDVDWQSTPVLRTALQRIINNKSINDIRSDALFLLSASNYWEFLGNDAMLTRKILIQAP